MAAAGPAAPQRGAVIRAVTAMLRRVGKVVAGAVPAVVLARLGLPALGAVVFLAAGVTCWLLGSDARTARVSRVLLAWKGGSGSLPADRPRCPSPARTAAAVLP